MKATLTTLLFVLSAITVFSQSNFYKIGIGGGAGITQSFTDVQKHGYGSAAYGVADYFFTPFISLGVEGQIGQINGGDIHTDPYNRQFINSYKSFTINGKIYLGGIINYNYSEVGNILKGLYIGGGLGAIKNKMTGIVRVNPYTGYKYPGQNQSKDILIPMNLGINFYFPDRAGDYRYVLNFNFQSIIDIGEGLDGYNDSPVKFKNSYPDMYSYISAGIRYQLGPVGLYRKTFRKP